MSTAAVTSLRAEDLPDLMPIDVWAEYTHLSKPTLARQRSDGTGAPFVTLGRSVRYPRERALAWLESLSA